MGATCCSKSEEPRKCNTPAIASDVTRENRQETNYPPTANIREHQTASANNSLLLKKEVPEARAEQNVQDEEERSMVVVAVEPHQEMNSQSTERAIFSIELDDPCLKHRDTLVSVSCSSATFFPARMAGISTSQINPSLASAGQSSSTQRRMTPSLVTNHHPDTPHCSLSSSSIVVYRGENSGATSPVVTRDEALAVLAQYNPALMSNLQRIIDEHRVAHQSAEEAPQRSQT